MSSSQVTLVTGLQGNAKTLYTIKLVKEWAEREKRPVFYHNITILDDVQLPWTPIDPLQWHTAPPGAIVLIDECQDVFRPRASSKEPPDHVKALEKLRHNGINLVLITQHPMLIDNAVRRLCGRHFHAIRMFGTETSTYHEWSSVRENCDKSSARNDSTKHVWKYDKKMYSWYKSAEVHTIKRKIPMRLLMLLTIPFILAGAAYLVWWLMLGKKQLPVPVVQPGQVQQGAVTQQPRQKEKWEDPLADARRFTYESTPRIAGMAHTAPKYDAVTQPTTAPMPTSCVASKTKCQCYSQQATVMAVEEVTCRSIVERGYFVEFGRDQDKSNQAHLSDQVNYTRADAVPVEPTRPELLAAADTSRDGYGVLGKRGPGVRQPGDAK